MTDAGNTGIAPKNTGGDYPARSSCFVHYAGRRIYFGREEESGRSLRRFFRVPDDETLYLAAEEREDEPVVILDDPKTMYGLRDGQRYYSEPIPAPAPAPELKPIVEGDIPPTMAQVCGDAAVAANVRPRREAPADEAPIPDFGVTVDASVLGEIHHRLTGIESAVKQVRTVADLAQDEAKRARTLAEENEALGRTNSRQTTDLLEKVVALKAIAAKTDTRLWNQAGLLTDILKALGGPDALLEMLGRLEKAVGPHISNPLSAPPSEEPPAPAPEPGKPSHRIAIYCNGQRYERVGAYEVDSTDLRQLFVLDEDDALLEVDGSGTTLDRILDGATVLLADEMRFVTVPNRAFVPRR